MHLCLRCTNAEGALLRKDAIRVVFMFTVHFFFISNLFYLFIL